MREFIKIESAAKALEQHGRLLLDNTIDDDNLEPLFLFFSGKSSKELDKFTDILFKYIDDQALYQLTQRLVSLEVRFNGHDNQCLRNKSLAKVCIIEIARREKFSEDYLKALFPYCNEFFALDKKIPAMLSSIFKAIFKQLRGCDPEVTTKSLGTIFVFNVVNTLLVKETNTMELKQQMAIVGFIKGVFDAINPSFEAYLKEVVERIDSCSQEPTFTPAKDARSLDDANTLLQLEAAQLQGPTPSAASISWPQAFQKLNATTEIEHAAAQMKILKIFRVYKQWLQDDMTEATTIRILADIKGMLLAFENNQACNFTQEISETAITILMELNCQVAEMQEKNVISKESARSLSDDIISTGQRVYELQRRCVQPSALKY